MEDSNHPDAGPDLPEQVIPGQTLILKSPETDSLKGLYRVRFKSDATEKTVLISRFEQQVVFFVVPEDIVPGTYKVCGGYPGLIPTVPDYQQFGTVVVKLQH